MKIKLFSSLGVLAGLISACSSTVVTRRADLVLQQEATITEADSPPFSKKKGEILTVTNKPMLVEAEGYIPVMLVPLGLTSTGQINLKPVDKLDGAALHRRESLLFSNLLSGVNDVQVKLASRRPYDALSLIEDLRNKYPDIVALKFLKASCLVAVGRQREAKALLEEALKEYPDDKFAKKMLNVLNNGASNYSGHSSGTALDRNDSDSGGRENKDE